jgi:hypothetical protein
LIGALLALAAGVLVRRAGSTRALRIAFAGFFALLPLVRLAGQPTPPQSPARDRPRPLGTPERALVMVAVEGLDSELLIDGAAQPSTPTLRELVDTGSWGPLDAFEPYLRWSLWTTLATGTEPGLHGVKAHRAWRLSPVFDGVLRLLPWTPQGSRHILPWWAADMVRPPASGVPALWARLRASGAATTVIEWPGVWPEEDEPVAVRRQPGTPEAPATAIESDIGEALAAFPDQRPAVVEALRRDRITVARAVEALQAGSDNLWIHLGSVLAVRENLEPLRPTHTRERRLRHLMMELVDAHVTQLLSAAPSDCLLVIVSPYGVSPPDVWERWRRLIGSGGDWRTSPLGCPDGVLLLAGRGVRAGHRVPEASITDVAPTVCYLLGLPIVQSMEGRVILDAMQPSWVESHPLHVVN